MRLFVAFIQVTIFSLLITACSEEAKPYEEINTSISDSQDQGYIQTH